METTSSFRQLLLLGRIAGSLLVIEVLGISTELDLSEPLYEKVIFEGL